MIYVESDAAYQDANEAWLGYDNAVTLVAASSEQPYGPPENTQNGLTFDHWQPSASGNQTLTLNVGQHDYIAISSHNCDTECSGVTVTVGDVDVLSTGPVPDRSPIWVHTQTRSGPVTLTFEGATTELRVGIVYCGRLLQMQRTEWQGATPVTHELQESRIPSTSDTGQYLGQILTREAYTASPSWDHLTSTWYRANVPPFVRATQTRAFFYAWQPASYPAEIAYGWRTGAVKPNNTGPADLMSMSFDFEGVSHER